MCESENRRTAAGYVRVSSTNNDADIQRGIAAQKDAIQQFAQESGRDVVWYVDGEKSVEDSNDEDGSLRPALRRLLDDAGSPDCGFDTVLVSSVSCLSRKLDAFHLGTPCAPGRRGRCALHLLGR